MKTEYKDHPLAELFPIIQSHDLKELAADIKANGQQVPIILLEHNGEPKILDGRNRMRACLKAEVEPITKSWEELKKEMAQAAGTMEKISALEKLQPLDWIVSMNLKRRHLSDTQREAVAAEIVVMREAQEKEAALASELDLDSDGKPKVTAESSEQERVDDASKTLNVKGRNVRKAVKVAKEGSDELKKAHKAGTIKTATAEKLLKLDKKNQDKLAKASAREQKRVEKIAEKAAKAADKKAGKKPRGGLAADKAKAKEGQSFSGAIKQAIKAVEDLAEETAEKVPLMSWEDYSKKVISRIRALD